MTIKKICRGVQVIWEWPTFAVGIGLGVGITILYFKLFSEGLAIDADWLAFSGGLIGVVLAIFGALFVENRKRRQDDKRNLVILLEAIDSLESLLSGLEDEYPEVDERLEEYRSLAQSLLSRLEEASSVLKYANKHSILTTAKQVEAVQSLERIVGDLNGMVKKEKGWIGRDDPTMPVLAVFLGKVRELQENVLPDLQAARGKLS